MNELICLAVIFYFVFLQYSPNPLNCTWLMFGMTFLSCLRSCSCLHDEYCLCWSKQPLPVWLSHSIQQDDTTKSNEAMKPQFTSSRLTALSLLQPTALFSSMSSLCWSCLHPFWLLLPLHPISVPFHPQLEIPTSHWQMDHKRRKEGTHRLIQMNEHQSAGHTTRPSMYNHHTTTSFYRKFWRLWILTLYSTRAIIPPNL